MDSYTFDLLDVGTQAVGANTKFMDNMAKAYFWHLVASFLQGARSPLGVPGTPPPQAIAAALATPLPEVVGLVVGCSGSTDLPAFVGLRVYSWEEPMLAALEGETTYKGSGNWTYKYCDLQGPQAMRLFNQYPLVVTGFLDLHTFRGVIVAGKPVRTYTKLNISDRTLDKWLQRVNTIPPLPSMERTRRLH
jgi:hypothetical protein